MKSNPELEWAAKEFNFSGRIQLQARSFKRSKCPTIYIRLSNEADARRFHSLFKGGHVVSSGRSRFQWSARNIIAMQALLEMYPFLHEPLIHDLAQHLLLNYRKVHGSYNKSPSHLAARAEFEATFEGIRRLHGITNSRIAIAEKIPQLPPNFA